MCHTARRASLLFALVIRFFAPFAPGAAQDLPFVDSFETGDSSAWNCASDRPCASGSCIAAGAACWVDGDCCNGLCDRPDGQLPGSCAVIGGCATAGESCSSDSQCCSASCAASGATHCASLDGCQPLGERCATASDCCSGSCTQSGTTADGRPILRCTLASSCLAAGEVCTVGSGASCCPPGGGDTGCKLASSGVDRCFGGTPGCVLPGDACSAVGDCCAETYPGIQCQAGAGGPQVCCVPNGQACAFDDVCCSGVCARDAGGSYVCSAF
jgi:hypothetical protein